MIITLKDRAIDAPIAAVLDDLKTNNADADVTVSPHQVCGIPVVNQRDVVIKAKSLDLTSLLYASTHGVTLVHLTNHRSGPFTVAKLTLTLPDA